MQSSFRDDYDARVGTAITEVLPAMSFFAPDGGHAETKARVLDELTAYHDRFADLGA